MVMPDAARAAAREVAALLREASSALFLTGAGVSAESGLPTYRGTGGLYERDPTDDGVPIEEALSGETLRTNPALAWKHIAAIERACRGARPNRAHAAMARVEARLPRTWIATQNVDGFHRDAGSKNVIELHGTLRRLRCTRCEHAEERRSYEGLAVPPSCPRCAALVRPDVVLFGERLPPRAVQAFEAELRRGFDVIFSVGTSSLFPYVSAPVLQAARFGTPTVEINPGDTELSTVVRHRLRAPAGEALEAVLAAWR